MPPIREVPLGACINPNIIWPIKLSHTKAATAGDAGKIGSIKPIDPNAIALNQFCMVIKIYTVPGCRTCSQVKEFLSKMELSYEEVNCDKNLDEAMAVMKLAGSEELPIIRYDEDNFIVGYHADNLRKLVRLCKPNQ